jgi:hypothetical protein
MNFPNNQRFTRLLFVIELRLSDAAKKQKKANSQNQRDGKKVICEIFCYERASLHLRVFLSVTAC